jgi:MFS family permease
MFLLPNSYVQLLKRKDFFTLSLLIFIGQAASAFLVLSLIVSVFLKTGSNLGVSGVILSFTIPAFFLMAFAGLFADAFDRRKIIIFANIFIALVVLVIIITQSVIYASIPLSFFYFAGNTFFIPASSAATAQLVSKKELLIANTIFIFTLAGGVLLGLFIASLVYFFLGAKATLFVCEGLLIMAASLSFSLPKMLPIAKSHDSLISRIKSLWQGVVYMFTSRALWFFFVTFAAAQGVIFFGITLAPGFFTEIIRIAIKQAIIFIFPVVGIGVLLGVYFIQKTKIRELYLISLGNSIVGLTLLSFGLLIKVQLLPQMLVALLSVPFLIFLGSGVTVVMVASRTAIQTRVPHTHQGIVFGANIILASLIATIMSILAVIFEVVFGYLGTFVLGGTVLISAGAILVYLGKRWKY